MYAAMLLQFRITSCDYDIGQCRNWLRSGITRFCVILSIQFKCTIKPNHEASTASNPSTSLSVERVGPPLWASKLAGSKSADEKDLQLQASRIQASKPPKLQGCSLQSSFRGSSPLPQVAKPSTPGVQ